MSVNGNDEFAEKMLLDCLDYSENYMTFNKIYTLEVYIQLLEKQDRKFEAESYKL